MTDALLDATSPQKVEYCIPMWLRDEQIKLATKRIQARVQAPDGLRTEPIALVCFGPSLNDTWEQLRGFRYIMSCSGAHKFLVERGIIPTWHVEVDPRAHKVALIGPPQPGVEYLIASTCHQAVFDHLEGYKVTLWHVFDAKDDAIRTLPPGEWALTGGCSVGLRTMTIARFLGFTEQHIFGMDGSAGTERNHADEHPNHRVRAGKQTEYPPGSGRMWDTSPAMLEAARGTWHELNQMPDVRATFYGDGLVQAMAKDYVPVPIVGGKGIIGFVKPELISAEYRALNAQLHTENLAYGVGGGKHAPEVLKMAEAIKTKNILDYGCGKGRLSTEIPWHIAEYDPCIPGKEASPKPADLVVCTDVLEHIEPELLTVVLSDLQRVVRQVGYFVIHTGPAQKTLPDGRNTHLIQRDAQWWRQQLQPFFKIGMMRVAPSAVTFVVGLRQLGKPKKALRRASASVSVPVAG